MKKSELKGIIKEEIISILSESTEQELKSTKELTAAIKDLEKVKKEAGLTEGTQEVKDAYDSVISLIREKARQLNDDDAYEFHEELKAFFNRMFESTTSPVTENNEKRYYSDYNKMTGRIISTMMNMKKYVERFPYFWQDDNPEALPLLDKAISAYEDFDEYMGYGSQNELNEENIGLADLEEMGYDAGVKAFKKVKGMFKNKPDFQFYKKGYMQGFTDSAGTYGLSETVTEEEEKEPSKAELKKTKGLAKAKEELASLTKEMKSLARKYKSAEGAEKEELVKDLKAKTKIKRELEAILNKM